MSDVDVLIDKDIIDHETVLDEMYKINKKTSPSCIVIVVNINKSMTKS
jgi:hypoxanthine-guanine phosphoribosyltransferase